MIFNTCSIGNAVTSRKTKYQYGFQVLTKFDASERTLYHLIQSVLLQNRISRIVNIAL